MNERVLVVGATRILRPAAQRLVERGSLVVAVARSNDDLGELRRVLGENLSTVAVDYRDVDAFSLAVRTAARTLDAALVYAPGGSDELFTAIRSLVVGPVVHAVTSIAAAPPRSPADIGEHQFGPDWYRLLLGWTADSRWHTPTEVSDAMLATLDAPSNSVLGSVRPWSSRPAP